MGSGNQARASSRKRAGTPQPPRWQVLVALGIVYVVWGSTFLAIKYAIDTLPPMLMAGTRFLLAGVLLYAWTLRPGQAVRPTRPSAVHWWAAAVSGTFMLFGGNGAVTWAEQRIDSGVAALLVASVPLWMALLGWWREGRKPNRLTVAGLTLGFVGVALLVRPDAGSTEFLAAFVVVIGALSWAWGSLYARRAALHPDPLRATAMQMLAGAGGFLVAGLLFREPASMDLAGASASSIWALVYLVVFGSLVAFTAYAWLLRNVAPGTVSTYAYVNPVVAVGLGALFLSEPLTSMMLGSGALIVAGVVLIVTGGRTRKPSPVPVAPEAGIVSPSAEKGPDADAEPAGVSAVRRRDTRTRV